MEKILIKQYKKPKITNSMLIGGLPGIGNVGKIAAEYMVDILKMQKMMDIYSQYFPPQVFVNEDGVAYLVRNSIYYKKLPGKYDLIVLVGDFQGTTQEGQYELSYSTIDILSKYGLKMIYTLGGYSTGKIVDNPRVLGAVTDRSLIKNLMDHGVVFPKGEPGGGIIGSAGIILGLGKEMFSIDGACLMGETSGFFADPKSAMNILKVLSSIIGIKIDLSEIEMRSQQMEQITGKAVEEMQQRPQNKEDLGYFG
ncbi:MAG: proteasome assembly chaperone family protein [Candidatus Thermoplasmatota archaeon]|nr:proteasome assembly chaperone family protein [Candidatus Thermoplasmatota archaeon]MCL5730727.1 proteasome assembly chaperone family protein [Candidatus Thermoplasmatota archaeon]